MTANERSDFQPVKEADLSGHLSNGKEEAAKSAPKAKPDSKMAESDNLASKDYPLYEALTLLKGLDIMQQMKK
jgi:carboxyl-terminal processing protease